jgi:hypothetical protein
MYTKFSGENGQRAARWLRTLEYELPPTFTPRQWLECVDGLLEGDAARWADSHTKVKRLLAQENIQNAGQAEKDTFTSLLLKRFAPVDEENEFYALNITKRLVQSRSESLEQYYRRAEDLLHASGGKDNSDAVALSEDEKAILRHVIEYFIRGIHVQALRTYIKCEPTVTGGWRIRFNSLYEAYTAARLKEEVDMCARLRSKFSPETLE